MTFLAPALLLGLLLVPLLAALYVWAQRRRSRYAVRFTNLDLLANIAPRRPGWRRHLPVALYLLAVATLAVGLARPTMVVPTPRDDATVILAIDVSGSMKAEDVAPSSIGRSARGGPGLRRWAARERPRRRRRLRHASGDAGHADRPTAPRSARRSTGSDLATGPPWATR